MSKQPNLSIQSSSTGKFQAFKEIPSAVKTPQQIEEEKKIQSLGTTKKQPDKNEAITTRRRRPSSPSPLTLSKPVTGKENVEGKATLKILSTLQVDQLCCQHSLDNKILATGGTDGYVNLFNEKTSEFMMNLTTDLTTKGQTACVTSIKTQPIKYSGTNDCLMCTYVNGLVKYFDYKQNKCLYSINEKRQTYGLAYHPKLHKFITYGDDLKINLYDSETHTKERIFEGSIYQDVHDGPSSRVFAGKFHPKNYAEFLTGGWDGTVLLWDLRQPASTRYISGPHLCGEGLDISKNGSQVLTCSWRKEDQIQLWDYNTFKLINTILPDVYTTKLYCGGFINDDFMVCGGGDPSLLRVVDRATNKSRVLITNLHSDVYHFNIASDKTLQSGILKKGNKDDDDDDVHLPDLTKNPKIVMVCGKHIYEVDFNVS